MASDLTLASASALALASASALALASASALALASASALAFVITSETLGAGAIFSILVEDSLSRELVLTGTGSGFTGGGAGGTESSFLVFVLESSIIIFSADFKS